MHEEPLRLADLTPAERIALGCMVRVAVRADGGFTREEHAAIHAWGEAHGSASEVWDAIARSATTHITEEAIHAAVVGVARWPARVLIVSAMDAVAAANGIGASERPILAFIRELWAKRAEGPFR